MPALPDPSLRRDESHFEVRDVDESAWDGPAAMSRCSNSDTPASCFRAICAGRKAGDPELQSSWALPHHKSPDSAPNRAGVNNALARFSQTQGLTNAEAARNHLERHQAGFPDRSEEPKTAVLRMIPTGMARTQVNGDGNTLTGYAAVTNTETEIEGYAGAFIERIASGAFKRTITNNGDRVKVLFNHGMDPSIGSKPLGKPSVMREDDRGLYVEVPLDETSYNQDLKANLRSGAIDGMSFMFDVLDEDWNEEHTERTIKEVKLYEFGPVTWPAYETTSVGIRSKGVYGDKAKPASPGGPARSNAPESRPETPSAWNTDEQLRRLKLLREGGEKT